MTKLFQKSSRDGYLKIDHRDSPGTEPGVRDGFEWIGVPSGTVFEAATFTCSRCTTVVIKNPGRDRGRGYCRKCDHDVCDRCALTLKLGHECSFDTCFHIKQIVLGAKTGA